MVVDCGSSNSAEDPGETAARYLLSRGRTRIDALILSHYHTDHMSGVPELLRRLQVRMLLAPPPEDENGAALLALAEETGTEVVIVSDELTKLSFGGLHATITPPLGNVGDNEQGLCALLQVDDYEVLLTGDASKATELRLLERLPLPDVELLIAGHHGSAGSSSEALLAAACPDVVVISVGRNNYGQPAQEALERLSANGAALYRTDRAGTVLVRYQGRKGAAEDE